MKSIQEAIVGKRERAEDLEIIIKGDTIDNYLAYKPKKSGGFFSKLFS